MSTVVIRVVRWHNGDQIDQVLHLLVIETKQEINLWLVY